MSNGRALIDCADCTQRRTHFGRGLCGSCFKRHHRNGTLGNYQLSRGGDGGVHVGETPISALAYWRGCHCGGCRAALREHRNRVDALPQALRTVPRDPRTLIEQALARTVGSVDKAALELAEQGISWQRIKEIWDAMEEEAAS
jgi:hypothetical protein